MTFTQKYSRKQIRRERPILTNSCPYGIVESETKYLLISSVVCFACCWRRLHGAPFVCVACNEWKALPHNSAARLAMSFPPSAACKFLDLHPVNLRNLHLHLTKNPFASRPPHLCGVTLNFPQALRVPKWRGVNRSFLLRQKCNSNYACKRAKISRSSARASSLRSMHRAIALIAVSPVMSRIDFSSPQ